MGAFGVAPQRKIERHERDPYFDYARELEIQILQAEVLTSVRIKFLFVLHTIFTRGTTAVYRKVATGNRVHIHTPPPPSTL